MTAWDMVRGRISTYQTEKGYTETCIVLMKAGVSLSLIQKLVTDTYRYAPKSSLLLNIGEALGVKKDEILHLLDKEAEEKRTRKKLEELRQKNELPRHNIKY